MISLSWAVATTVAISRCQIASSAPAVRSTWYSADCQDVRASAASGAALLRALHIATQRRELSLALRAATSLARLWKKRGRGEEAVEQLSGVYSQFTEGFETADLRAAREVFSELGAKVPAGA